MTQELRAGVDGATIELEAYPLDPSQVIGGAPAVAVRKLSNALGIWEHTVGVSTDVEIDETFIVISGSGTIEFTDGRAPLTLSPGVIATLSEGEGTTWTITSTLRKLYIIPAQEAPL